MKSEVILKRDSLGKLRSWQFEVNGGAYRTIAGMVGGAQVESGWTICQPKNVGRTNATTAEQQALAEGEAELNKKLDREYRRTEPELEAVPPSPMLAQDFGKQKKIAYPVAAQPKLDGIRSMVSRHGAFSREYQQHKSVEHILEALAPVFERYPELVLDGELYNHDLKDDFNTITSLVRREKTTEAQRAQARSLIQFHVYDMPHLNSFDFILRFGHLKKIMGEFPHLAPLVQLVPTDEARNVEELDALNARYLEAGYEGQMVRLDLPYEFDKRSKSLLKRKVFETAEFKVKSIEEGLGNWAGCAKRVVLEVPGAPEGECGAGLRGTQEFAKVLLADAQIGVLPAEATVRYFGRTPDGSLRFPVVTDFHQNGRVD